MRAGSVIAGKYRVTEPLGRGGMGAVWRAEHVALGTPLAVKLMDPEIAATADGIARFSREARAAAALRSPHVVHVFDFGVDDGTPYIAMELLEGESLAQLLARIGRLAPEEVTTLFTELGRAVSKAHELGIVHRDLKPDNVFLARQDRAMVVKVLDFGIAKLTRETAVSVSSNTRTGTMLGTPSYMSPEQARGNRLVDHRTDIWALGVVAFESLCGRKPFLATTLGDLIIQICTEPLPIPSEVAAVPRGFDAWFERAAARDPNRRFQSVTEQVEALVVALGTTVPTSPSLPRLSNPAASAVSVAPAAAQKTGAASSLTLGAGRRSRVPRIALAAAVVLSGVIGGLAFVRMRMPRPPELVTLSAELGRALSAARPATSAPSAASASSASEPMVAPTVSSTARTTTKKPERGALHRAGAPATSSHPTHKKWGI